MSIKSYYELAKPGMVYGNAIPLVSGFVLASGRDLHPGAFLATLVGASLGMASGCVCNNYVDRDIDAKMRRTKHRAVASGRISGRAALAYGAALGIAGAAVLTLGANVAATAVGAVGFFFYVFMYSMWWKRRSPMGAAFGSVAGAMPPVVGYVAASGKIDVVAAILFATMVAWQMPHFFAIAIRHADDYAAAKIPALPLVRGIRATKMQTALYIAAFIVVAPLLSVFGHAGRAYFAVTLLAGVAWLGLGLWGFRIPDGDKDANGAWAREMFIASLVVMIALFLTMAYASVV